MYEKCHHLGCFELLLTSPFRVYDRTSCCILGFLEHVLCWMSSLKGPALFMYVTDQFNMDIINLTMRRNLKTFYHFFLSPSFSKFAAFLMCFCFSLGVVTQLKQVAVLQTTCVVLHEFPTQNNTFMFYGRF